MTLAVTLELNPNMFYLLGALKGDGCVDNYRTNRYRIRFFNTSEKLISSVEDSMKHIGLNPRLEIREGHGKWCYLVVLRASSKMFYEFYNSFTYPDLGEYVESSDDGRDSALAFLRGVYESDGCYHEHKSGWGVVVKFSNTDEVLIDFCCKLLKFLGFSYSCHPEKLKSGKTRYTVSILGGRCEYSRFLSEVSPCIKRGGD